MGHQGCVPFRSTISGWLGWPVGFFCVLLGKNLFSVDLDMSINFFNWQLKPGTVEKAIMNLTVMTTVCLLSNELELGEFQLKMVGKVF